MAVHGGDAGAGDELAGAKGAFGDGDGGDRGGVRRQIAGGGDRPGGDIVAEGADEGTGGGELVDALVSLVDEIEVAALAGDGEARGLRGDLAGRSTFGAGSVALGADAGVGPGGSGEEGAGEGGEGEGEGGSRTGERTRGNDTVRGERAWVRLGCAVRGGVSHLGAFLVCLVHVAWVAVAAGVL